MQDPHQMHTFQQFSVLPIYIKATFPAAQNFAEAEENGRK